MSTRQLKKLQKQRELKATKEQLPESKENLGSEDEDEDEIQPAKKSTNLFAKFAALEQDDADDADDDIVDQEEHFEEPETSAAITPQRKAKKAKKKKKAKAKESGKNEAEIDIHTTKDGVDEIDAALKELEVKQPGRPVPESITPILDPHYERVCALLGINNQYLKVANEMRNLFGRTAVENHDDAGGPVPRGARRRQRAMRQQVDLETALKGHHPPGKGLPELTLRRNIFIQGKDDWPKATTGGLTMEVVEDGQLVDGTVEFRFVHNQMYEQVQRQFRMFVQMGDPQNLIGLLQRNPYNISLLLQVSKIAKDQGDHALSSDLVERALFTFARASTSLFSTKLSQGKARLDFSRPENRELWLAGYQYIRSLIMKGTYRTALEWAKLLLSFDPEDDPYSMVLLIHHLALRAREFQFVLDFADIQEFPAWKFAKTYTSPSSVLAAMYLKDGVKCRAVLRHSIQHTPWLFVKLFQELNIDDLPPSIWGVFPRTNAETLFTEMYVRQTKDLWNTPEATSLLVEVAHATDKITAATYTVPIADSEITLDVARFVYLENIPSEMALVPSAILHRIPNSDSDPLPPDYNNFSWDSQRADFYPDQARSRSGGALAEHFDPMAALRALLPRWTRDLGLEAGNEDGEAGGEIDIRELLETDIQREDAEAAAAASGNEDNVESIQAPSTVRRLYDYLFGGRPSTPNGETRNDEENTDTGEEHD